MAVYGSNEIALLYRHFRCNMHFSYSICVVSKFLLLRAIKSKSCLSTSFAPQVKEWQCRFSRTSSIIPFDSCYIITVSVLITNEMHNSYNHFFIPEFFSSAVHVSNESSRSSSGARHNVLYYTVW